MPRKPLQSGPKTAKKTPSVSKAVPVSSGKKTVLLAVTGMSPAVLTETVWALAHAAEPVLVDEVYVMTTMEGRSALLTQLFGSDGGWDRMVAALSKTFGSRKTAGKFRFGTSDDCIRVLASPDGRRNLSDVASSEDNAQMADYFLKTIREFTEDPSVVLYASIAGGRKTMSALMLSCMTLVGRAEDHVLHVLVNEPFDRPLVPPFLFPERGVRHRAASAPAAGKAVSHPSESATISLIDLPFVKMRGWYQDKFREQPSGYGVLVRAAQAAGPRASMPRPMLSFDFDRGLLLADEEPVALSATGFMALAADLLLTPPELHKTLMKARDFLNARLGMTAVWYEKFAEGSRFSEGRGPDAEEGAKIDLTKVRTELRSRLGEVPSLAPYVRDLVPRGFGNGSWPAARMSADIPKFKKLVGLP